MVGKPWHEEHPEELAEIRSRLDLEFPYLNLTVRDGRTVFAGQLPVVLDGEVVDEFEIEVIVPPGGPHREIPVVREVGGRIPCDRERHIEEKSGDACLCVRDEYWYKNPDGMNLLEFLRGPVTSFFVSQFSFEQGNGWPFGHRGHGAAGILEFYGHLLGTSNPETIGRYLEMISAGRVRPMSRCPCGSRRRVARCHEDLIREVRSRVHRHVAAFSLGILKSEAMARARRHR